MKKFFGCFVLCMSISSTFGMKRSEPMGGFDDSSIVVCKQRKMLLQEQQDELNNKLFKVLSGDYKSKKYLDDVCAQAQKLLDQGADPDSNSVLWLTAQKEGYSAIVSLLLAYGAHPNLHTGVTDFAVPVVDVADLATIQVLVQEGADINASKPKSRKTLLGSLCGEYGADNLPTLVWALSHGADPNAGPRQHDCTHRYACFAIHKALFNCSLEKIIALLQRGANLDVETDCFEKPLIYAQIVLRQNQEAGSVQVPAAQAQLELLRALSVGLDPCCLYTIGEYVIMGISSDSAQLIQKATEDVNDAFAQCK